MFTGIISDLGEVLDVHEKAEGLRRITVACGYDPDSIAIGASIACSGVCLTVVGRGRAGNRSSFSVDTAAETLRMTRPQTGSAAPSSISSARCGLATSSAAIWSADTSTGSPKS